MSSSFCFHFLCLFFYLFLVGGYLLYDAVPLDIHLEAGSCSDSILTFLGASSVLYKFT